MADSAEKQAKTDRDSRFLEKCAKNTKLYLQLCENCVILIHKD